LHQRLLAAITLLVPWASTPFILSQVLERNAMQGLYGNGDAIIIPIAGAYMLCLLGTPFLALALGLVVWRLGRPSVGIRSLLTWRLPLAVLLITPALLIVLLGLLSWLSWEHLPIAISYFIPLAWLVWAVAILSRPPPILPLDETPSGADEINPQATPWAS
jgi:hypothetical protein